MVLEERGSYASLPFELCCIAVLVSLALRLLPCAAWEACELSPVPPGATHTTHPQQGCCWVDSLRRPQPRTPCRAAQALPQRRLLEEGLDPRDKDKMVLSMEDVAEALHEYGIALRRPLYYANPKA